MVSMIIDDSHDEGDMISDENGKSSPPRGKSFEQELSNSIKTRIGRNPFLIYKFFKLLN